MEKKRMSRRELCDELEKLKEQLNEEKTKSGEYLKRLVYLQADFENYKKRVEKEWNARAAASNEKLITGLLDVIEEFELAVEAVRESREHARVTEGLEMILKKMYSTLEREGLARIEAAGTPFDPTLHQAVERVQTEDYADGTVVGEVRKGYTLNGRTIRPSMVKVAVRPVIKPESLKVKGRSE